MAPKHILAALTFFLLTAFVLFVPTTASAESTGWRWNNQQTVGINVVYSLAENGKVKGVGCTGRTNSVLGNVQCKLFMPGEFWSLPSPIWTWIGNTNGNVISLTYNWSPLTFNIGWEEVVCVIWNGLGAPVGNPPKSCVSPSGHTQYGS